MSFKVRAEIKGLKNLVARLNELDEKMRRTLLRKAVNAAAGVILKAAKSNLRKSRTGQLRRSLGRKVKLYRKSGVAVAMVGPRKGFKIRDAWGENVDPVHYAHLVEKGRKEVVAGVAARRQRQLKGNARSIRRFLAAVRKGLLGPQRDTGKKALIIRGVKGRGGKKQGGLVFATKARAARPYPFMKPAIDRNHGPVRDAIARVIREGLASKSEPTGD